MAVFRMFMPALICRSISQSHIKQTNSLPTLSRRRAPHAGQVFDVHCGLTLIRGTPARAALYSIWRWISPRGHEDSRRFIFLERPPAGLTGDQDNLAPYHGERTEAPRRVLQE